jgi:hypothetical protein
VQGLAAHVKDFLDLAHVISSFSQASFGPDELLYANSGPGCLGVPATRFFADK